MKLGNWKTWWSCRSYFIMELKCIDEDLNKPTSRTFCWPFVGILLANLSTLSSVPCRSSKILQYEGWRIRTSLRCLEILFGLLVESPVVVASPDEVTLESKASLLPTTTYWKSIKTKYCISHILGKKISLFILQHSFLFYLCCMVGTFVWWGSFCDRWCSDGYGRGNSRSSIRNIHL